ncbi:MAG: hypothetical protein ACRCXE_02330, partial [Metamycoplasmataceae bacterium]
MMKKNMKKMALGVMTAGAFIVPLAVVASCGSSTADEVTDFSIESKSNPRVRTTDIDDNKYKEYKTLSKLFEGLDTYTLNNVSVSLKGDVAEFSSKNRIVLTANVGYTIKGQKTITSEEFTVLPTVFEITPIIQAPTNISSSDLFNVNNIDFLKRLFEGIEYDDLDNMEVILNESEDTTNPQEYSITLQAKGEFEFNVGNNVEGEKVKSITSATFTTNDLNLDIKVNKEKVEILKADIENDNYKSLATLQKLFIGINAQNLKNIEAIEINDDYVDFGQAYLVTLVAADGYKINGRHTLVSNEFILPNVLDIEQVTAIPKNITHLDLKKTDEYNGFKDFEFLKRIFTNIKEDHLEHLEIELTNTTDNTNIIRPEGTYTITLKIKEGANFVFLDWDLNEVKQITSELITLVPFNYQMYSIQSPSIGAIDIWDNKYKELATLEKLFTNITQEILDNLEVEITGDGVGSETNHRVVLLAKDGYSINGAKTLVSDDFTLEATKDITIARVKEITESITNIELENPNLSLLEKLFTGEALAAEFINYDIIVDKKAGSIEFYSVILKAKPGYSINGQRTFESLMFQIETILDITPNNSNVILSAKEVNEAKISLETLQKLFVGITETNYAYISASLSSEEQGSATSHTITLTANDLFTFIDGKTISKSFTLETILEITPKEEDVILSMVEAQNINTSANLKKLFDHLNDINAAHIEFSLDDNGFGSGTSHTITLTAKSGFVFENGLTSISKTFTLENVLIITPKIEDVILSVNEINDEAFKNPLTLNKLFNGVNLITNENVTITISDEEQGSGTSHTITLTRKDGFVFENGLTSISKTFTLETNLEISPKDLSNLFLSRKDITTDLETLATLSKLFNGLNDTNLITNIKEIKLVGGDIITDLGGSKHRITLIANEGFVFANGTYEITSQEFTLETVLNISPKVDLPIFSAIDVTTNIQSYATLSKLFNGFTEADVTKVVATLNGVPGSSSKHTITLKASDAFTFTGYIKEITSNEFTLEAILDISIQDINNLILKANEVSGENYKTVETLNKLFTNINVDDISKMTIKLNGDIASGSEHTITITANYGFAFTNHVKELVSQKFSLETILNITPKVLNSLILNRLDVINNLQSFETLTQLFEGLTADDLLSNKVSATLNGEIDNDENTYTITLTTEYGFTFTGGITLQSNQFSLRKVILAKKVLIDPKNITHLDLQNNGYKTIDVLGKLFTNLNSPDLNHLKITITNQGSNGNFAPLMNHVITIETIGNYTFLDDLGNEIDTLVSIEFDTVAVNFEITMLNNPTIINSDIDNNKYKELVTLEKLFTGVANIMPFITSNDISVVLSAPNTRTRTHTVSLNTIDGFTINGARTFDSDFFTLNDIINITKRVDINNAEITHLDILELLDSTSANIDKKLTLLGKLFTGVNTTNIDLFTITSLVAPTPGQIEQSITLTALDGYVFIENNLEVGVITSSIFTSTEILEINPNSVDMPILSINDVKDGNYILQTTIIKLFEGINDTNYNNINVEIDNHFFASGTIHTITLEARAGFTFNGSKTISKKFTLETLLEISPKTESPILSASDIEGDSFKSLATVKKLFEGVNEISFENITITIDHQVTGSASQHTITLTRKDGFIFAGDKTTISKIFTLETILVITRIESDSIILSRDEVIGDNLSSRQTLEKFFNFNYDDVIGNITVSLSGMQIKLLANPGFTFGGNLEILSVIFSYEAILDITPIDEAVILSINDIKDETSYMSHETLSKLFNGLSAIDLDNITVSISNEELGSATTHTITLEGQYGFTFTDGKIISKTFTLETILNITPKDEVVILSANDIKDKTSYMSLETLSKLFNNLNTTDLANIKVSISDQTPGSATTHTITLEGQYGFTFTGGKAISKTFTLETILIINPKEEVVNRPVILSIEEVRDNNFDNEFVLKKLFNNLNADYKNYVTVDINDTNFVEGQEYTITLTRNDGFIFANNEPTISKTFTLETVLNISIIDNPGYILTTDINGGNEFSITTLSKLFNLNDAITPEMVGIAFHVSVKNLADNNKSLTLTAEWGYKINGVAIIESEAFLPHTVMNISVKNLIDLVLNSNDVYINLHTTATLKKLFLGPDQQNINNVKAVLNDKHGDGSIYTVTLSANDGFLFPGNSPEIISQDFTMEI